MSRDLAKAKHDRDDIRAETYKILDAAQKGNGEIHASLGSLFAAGGLFSVLRLYSAWHNGA